MGEVVTFQFGHYSNFVGSHYWNLEECQQDKTLNQLKSFHISQNEKESDYVPRMLLFDLKDSFGSLSKYGNTPRSSSISQNPNTWDGAVTKIEQIKYPKNSFLRGLDDAQKQFAYNQHQYVGGNVVDPLKHKKHALAQLIEKENIIIQGVNALHQKGEAPTDLIDKLVSLQKKKKELSEDIGRMEVRAKEMSGEIVDPKLKYNFNLDQTVSVWSDYLKVFVDENNIFSYDEYSHLNESQPFDVFNYGQSVFKTYDYEEEIESKLHRTTEQCDRLQGFHAFCDIDSGFAGIAEDMLSFVREEFPRAPICFFGFYGAPKDMTRKSKAKRILNLSLSMTTLSQLSSVYFPLSHKHWDTNIHFPYLKLEKEKKFHSSAIFAAAINTLTRPYRDATNSYSMHQFTSSLATSTERNICTLEASFPLPLYYEQPLNTLLNRKSDPIYASNWMYPLTPNTTRNASVAPYSCSVVMRGVPPSCFTRSPDYSSPDQFLQYYLSNFSCPSRESFTFNNNVPWQIPITFPKFFSSSVSSDGLLETSNGKESIVNSVPALVNAQTTKQSSNLVSLLANACKDIDLGTLPEFQLQKTELNQLHDNLQHIYDLYQS